MSADTRPNVTVNCPLCGSAERRILFRDRNRRDGLACTGVYARCGACALIYLGERPPWEAIVGYYSATGGDLTVAEHKRVGPADIRPMPAPSAWRLLFRRWRASAHDWPLEHVVPPGSRRILDVGCSGGHKLARFARRGWSVWGVDVGAAAIADCRAVFPPEQFHLGEIKDAPWPDGFFDAVRIDNTLEHVPDPRAVTAACHRLLRPGGRLYMYVPHGRSLTFRLLRGGSISAWIPFHLQLFTRATLRRLLHEVGFARVTVRGHTPASWIPLSIIQVRGRGGRLVRGGYPGWLKAMCRPLAWLARSLSMAEELVAVAEKADAPRGGT
ncbi:MAG: methyltransferase domain-containing protein [Planctomycetota bacterium]